MENLDWIAKRVTQLRIQKGVSARDMSLSLGQSESYINKIENSRTLPSMQGLFYICEYFQIEPRDFFDQNNLVPRESTHLLSLIQKLTPEQVKHIQQIVLDILGE